MSQALSNPLICRGELAKEFTFRFFKNGRPPASARRSHTKINNQESDHFLYRDPAGRQVGFIQAERSLGNG